MDVVQIIYNPYLDVCLYVNTFFGSTWKHKAQTEMLSNFVVWEDNLLTENLEIMTYLIKSAQSVEIQLFFLTKKDSKFFLGYDRHHPKEHISRKKIIGRRAKYRFLPIVIWIVKM